MKNKRCENMRVEKWDVVIMKYKIGELIEGVVLNHTGFGIFLDIKEKPVLGLVRIVNILDDGNISPESYPPIGSKVLGVITDCNKENYQINISLKPTDIKIAKTMIIEERKT